MRCACIDIGSNTTRLLVVDLADGRFAPVVQERCFTRLGRSCRAGGTIPEATVAELAQVLAGQVRVAYAAGVAADALRVVATAAVRRAANHAAVCEALRAAVGVAVDVLDTEAEARLAFAGATRTLVNGAVADADPLGVVDVGGGSSELIVGTRADGVTWSHSLAFGSGDLAEAHLRSDPPAAAELDALRARVAEAFAGVTVGARPVRVLAVGGSATSIGRLLGRRFDAASLRQAVTLLAAAPVEELARRHDLDPVRVRLLPAGILVLAAAADLLGPLEVADGGLREGVVLELARR